MQFAPEDERDFKIALQKNGLTRIEKALSMIDVATAQASVEKDRMLILNSIQKQMTLEDFNNRVRDGLRLEYRRVSASGLANIHIQNDNSW